VRGLVRKTPALGAFRRHFDVAKIGLLALTLTLAHCSSLLAAPVKNVTYEQFEQLVKEKTAEIPELQTLWSWRANHHEPVYLGGGILRGLLKWLEENLRDSSFENVRKMAAPRIEELLIQKDADWDLYHDRVGADWFKENMPEYGSWDILTREFREQSIEAGGPTIEKIRVSPNQVEDPLGGLKAFYEGKLTYIDVPEWTFRKFRGTKKALSTNMKSALVLRELRFANEIPSAELDEETKLLLRSVVKSELKRIKPQNYWIQKSLKKFHASTGGSVERTMKLLREYGLAGALAKNGYYLEEGSSGTAAAKKYVLLQFSPDEISNKDFKAFKRSTNDIAANIEGMKYLLSKADNIERVVSIFEPAVDNPNSDYLNAISHLMMTSTERPEWAKFDPKDLRPLKAISSTVESRIALMKLGVRRAKTPSEFFDAIKLDTDNPSDAYKNAVNNFIKESVGTFMDLKPSAAEMNQLKNISGRIDTNIEAMKKGIDQAMTAKDFFAAVSPGVSSPTDEYTSEIKKLVEQSLYAFAKLDPSAKEMDRFKELSNSIEANIALMRIAIPKAESAGAFLKVLNPGVKNPHPAYESAILKLAIENQNRFLELEPSTFERAKFESRFHVSLPNAKPGPIKCLIDALKRLG
jgi:hypothetical protein